VRQAPPAPFVRRAAPTKRSAPRSNLRGAFITIALLTLASGLVGGTAAAFNSATTNGGFIAAPALSVVTGFSGVAQDNTNVKLTWSAGTAEGNGYTILKDAGAPAYPDPCGTATYATTLVTATALLTLTDAQAATAAQQGMFVCYKALRVYTPPGSGTVLWTSQNSGSQTNPTKDVQLGMVATSITFTNGGTGGGLIDTNDLIDIVYNQPTNQPAVGATVGVCLDHSTGNLWFEVPNSATTCKLPVGPGNVGSVQGMAVTFNPANKDAVFTASYTWVSNTHLQVKITGSTGTATATVTNVAGTHLPTASLGIKSTGVAGPTVNICVTVAARCNPTATGSF
jgi:hypothetical protein